MAKRFIHSYSTRPLRLQSQFGFDSVRRIATTICYHALSVAYLKRIGQPIALYTDTLGKALLGFLPYDEIHTTLDDIPESIHPRFWAAGKVYAMAAEGCGCVHIDGDVFIKKAELAERILNSTSDVIVQDYESAEWTIADHEVLYPIANELKEFGIEVGEGKTGAYNVGVLGINNLELFHSYIDRYKQTAEFASAKLGNLFDVNHNVTPDLVVEQCNLLQLCNQNGYSVDTLLPPYGENYFAKGEELGYQHVLGPQKFVLLWPCLETLSRIDSDLFADVSKMVKNILGFIR